jgi:hypothetical protein
MPKRLSEWTASVFIALLSPAILAAQDTGPPVTTSQQRVIVAVLEHIDSMLIAGGAVPDHRRLILDPTVLIDSNLIGGHAKASLWQAQGLELIAEQVGAGIGPLVDYHCCAKGVVPGQCRMDGADAVILFGRPAIQGQRATIDVRVIHRAQQAPDPMKAFRTSAVYELVKRDGAWKVIRILSGAVS